MKRAQKVLDALRQDIVIYLESDPVDFKLAQDPDPDYRQQA
jgi:hypothetical protein